jgi:CubicO group peptidase (beta-lactamase class C family)
MAGFSKAGLARLDEVLASHTERGDVPGLTYVVARGDDVHWGATGVRAIGGSAVTDDSIFRIASMTKPVTAVAALTLVEECKLRLDEPVDNLLPELTDRRVMRDPRGSIDDTVPANRPVTLADLLTFRLGLGMDFAAWGQQPALNALAAALGEEPGPPQPQIAPAPDEWMRRLSTVPLERQPGERWLYHTSADVLGVLVARAAGQPLDAVLRERVFEPLGMVDTGFSVPAADLGRFGPCYSRDLESGERMTFDEADGQWSTPPAFASGGGGLVSTTADFLAFAQMLLGGGEYRGTRVLSRPSVDAMTTNYLTDEQRVTSSPDPSGTVGWGYCVAVQMERTGPTHSVGTYSWEGGLGSSWANDPAEDLTGVILTNQAFTTAALPEVCQDFWTCAYAALDD